MTRAGHQPSCRSAERPGSIGPPGLTARPDLAAEVQHFCHAMRTDTDFVISIEDALSNVAVNDAILRSTESGMPETVDEIWS